MTDYRVMRREKNGKAITFNQAVCDAFCFSLFAFEISRVLFHPHNIPRAFGSTIFSTVSVFLNEDV